MNIDEVLTRATPRPWHVQFREIVGEDGRCVAILCGDSPYDVKNANALLCTHAVGSFAALLRACNFLLAALEVRLTEHDDPNHPDILQARAAIAQAKGVQLL